MLWADVITILFAFIAIIISLFSIRESIKTRKMSLPEIKVTKIVESFDTRLYNENQVIWYWNLNISNNGGRGITLQGIKPKNNLPFVISFSNNSFFEQPIPVDFYFTNESILDNIKNDSSYLNGLEYCNWEKLQSLNIPIQSGESTSFVIVLRFNKLNIAGDQFLLNISLKFSTEYEYDLTRIIKIQ